MRQMILFLLIYFLSFSVSFTCSCDVPKSANEAMKQAKFVFQGKLVRHEHSGNLRGGETVALVQVSRVWKGINQSEVLLYTDWSSCGFQFEDGRSYLFYAFDKNGKPYVYNCGKTNFLELAAQDLNELGQGNMPAETVNGELEYFWVTNFDVVFKTTFVLVMGFLMYYFLKSNASERNG